MALCKQFTVSCSRMESCVRSMLSSIKESNSAFRGMSMFAVVLLFMNLTKNMLRFLLSKSKKTCRKWPVGFVQPGKTWEIWWKKNGNGECGVSHFQRDFWHYRKDRNDIRKSVTLGLKALSY